MTRSKIRTSGAEGLTLSSTALTVANGLTLTDGNVTLASGHGIDFAATGNSSGSVATELLDDYEEGTFTPAATAGGVTLSTAAGSYTKIGRMVHCTFMIEFPSTSNSGGAEISGFPFTCQNGNQLRGGFAIGATNKDDNILMVMSGNASNATFQTRSNSVTTNASLSGKFFIGGGSYPTES